MRIIIIFLMLTRASVAIGAEEEWIRIESANDAVSMEYSKTSIEPVSPTIKRAKTRFVANKNEVIPGVNVYSVASEIEYHCLQPLEKLLSVEIVATAGAVPHQETAESPVFSEIRHGSNSFRLWLQICSRNSVRQQ